MRRQLPRKDKSALGQAIYDMGLEIQRAAELCGLHFKTMQGYCKVGRTGSRNPTAATLAHICATLSLDASQFPTRDGIIDAESLIDD